jgi:hypothetical protein
LALNGQKSAFIYGGDNEIPAYALLAEYDNGSAIGNGRGEYVYLPTDDGSALLMGVLKGNQLLPFIPTIWERPD